MVLISSQFDTVTMIFNAFIVFTFFYSFDVFGSRVYKRRNISELAWNGVNTGIRIKESSKLRSVSLDSHVTAHLQCSMVCSERRVCGLFHVLTQEEGLVCVMRNLKAFTFLEESTGPEIEVYIRQDLMNEAGKIKKNNFEFKAINV